VVTFKSEINEINGVHQIKIEVPFNVKFVCLYLFNHKGHNILIDAGLNWGNWKKLLLSTFNDLNLSMKDIDYCFITHVHLDHIGLLKTLKRRNPDLKIVMNEITHKVLEWETNDNNLEELTTEAKKTADMLIKCGIDDKQGEKVIQFFTFWPKYLQYQKPDIIVRDGENVLEDLEIIWTPGHSFGHICIFDAKREFLYSGDHILSRITPHIGNFVIPASLRNEYKNHKFDNILHHYLNSLDRIDKLNPKIIFPAHQEIIYNPHDRILEIKKHHQNRLNEISSLIKDHPMTPYEISKIHFGQDLDEINSFMALSEVVGHLIYLEYQEKVNKIEKNRKVYFSS